MLWLEGLTFLLDILLMSLIFFHVYGFLLCKGAADLMVLLTQDNQNLAVQFIRTKLCQKKWTVGKIIWQPLNYFYFYGSLWLL